jgi:hypothetical protein
MVSYASPGFTFHPHFSLLRDQTSPSDTNGFNHRLLFFQTPLKNSFFYMDIHYIGSINSGAPFPVNNIFSY